VVRPDSLSGRHRTLDLKRLYEADRALLASTGLPKEAADQLRRHESHIRGRYELRRFLDVKAQGGLLRAARHALARPLALPAIVGGVAGDKFDAFRARSRRTDETPAAPRLLLQAGKVGRSS
jgi:succinoglycan biosynthesis protein ExoU